MYFSLSSFDYAIQNSVVCKIFFRPQRWVCHLLCLFLNYFSLYVVHKIIFFCDQSTNFEGRDFGQTFLPKDSAKSSAVLPYCKHKTISQTVTTGMSIAQRSEQSKFVSALTFMLGNRCKIAPIFQLK